jgi:hypothetical protein
MYKKKLRRIYLRIIIIIIIIIMSLDSEITGWTKELTTFENTVTIDSVEGGWKVNIRINEREMIRGKKLLDTPVVKGTIS